MMSNVWNLFNSLNPSHSFLNSSCHPLVGNDLLPAYNFHNLFLKKQENWKELERPYDLRDRLPRGVLWHLVREILDKRTLTE